MVVTELVRIDSERFDPERRRLAAWIFEAIVAWFVMPLMVALIGAMVGTVLLTEISRRYPE